jgi:hypothetical protein
VPCHAKSSLQALYLHHVYGISLLRVHENTVHVWCDMSDQPMCTTEWTITAYPVAMHGTVEVSTPYS